jgi:hypothetical protein
MTRTAPSIQVVDILATKLAAVPDVLCTERYGGPVSLDRVDEASRPPSAVRFHLHGRHGLGLKTDFSVHHVGGTAYDVHGAVEDGSSRTSTYSLPGTAPLLTPRAPHLAREIASFLLDTLEQRVGNTLLRTKLRDRQGAPCSNRPARP